MVIAFFGLILPLEPGTVQSIMRELNSKKNLKNMIAAVTIEKQGSIEFMAGDNFDKECVSVGKAISGHLLEELKAQGIIKRYRPVITT